MNQPPLRERTRGKWYGILTGVGIDPSYLRNKHGPCPICGGTDRFRWDDKNGDGTFYCNQCEPHAGSGIDLVMRIKGLSFRDAAPLIENYMPPQSVETLMIMADNDDNGVGRRAAEKLAARLSSAKDTRGRQHQKMQG